MPEQGRYEKLPRPESIAKLIEYLSASRAVADVTRESEQVISVKRAKHVPLRVFVTNIYIVGLADVYEILAQAGDVDAIVTMSSWNGYTSEAKLSCKEQGIGLFKFNEFLGAVHHDGNQYLDYVPPDERKRKRRLGRKI